MLPRLVFIALLAGCGDSVAPVVDAGQDAAAPDAPSDVAPDRICRPPGDVCTGDTCTCSDCCGKCMGTASSGGTKSTKCL